MKCPACDHVSEKALLKCSECGNAFDRNSLETLEHIRYLVEWLRGQEPNLSPDAYKGLIREASVLVKQTRHQLRLEEVIEPAPRVTEPVPSTLVHPVVDPLLRDLLLSRAALTYLNQWLKLAVISKGHKATLQKYFETRINRLESDLQGRPPPRKTFPELAVIEFVLKELPNCVDDKKFYAFQAGDVGRDLEKRRNKLEKREPQPSIVPPIFEEVTPIEKPKPPISIPPRSITAVLPSPALKGIPLE